MHEYSIDKHPKAKVYFSLAFLAILITPQIQIWIQRLVEFYEMDQAWSAPPVAAIPVFTIFAALHLLFDRVLWRSKAFGKLFAIPNLNGRWKCEGKTVLSNGQPVEWPWEAEVTISQTWSKILIHLQAQTSESMSISASLFRVEGVGFRILYHYANDPKVDQQGLKKHSGSTDLCFRMGSDSAEGQYYSDNHRMTVGTMKLRRINDK